MATAQAEKIDYRLYYSVEFLWISGTRICSQGIQQNFGTVLAAIRKQHLQLASYTVKPAKLSETVSPGTYEAAKKYFGCDDEESGTVRHITSLAHDLSTATFKMSMLHLASLASLAIVKILELLTCRYL